MDILEIISGNRVHYAINTLGGVRRDLDEGQRQDFLDKIDILRKRSEYYLKIGSTEPTFVGRLAGVGKLPREKAIDLCAVGPTLRASDVAQDVRRDDPYGIYDEVPFEVCTADTCDVLARVVVRIKEVLQSYNMIDFMLKNLPGGEVKVKAPRRAKPSEVVSRYEAPRGENIHYIVSAGGDKPERLKVRSPTLGNYAATVEMLKDGFIADIPLIFAAIDPCICCAERTVETVDLRTGEENTLLFSELRARAKQRFEKNPGKGKGIWPF
jgi:membrane-bound hydrogenase subunit alpha